MKAWDLIGWDDGDLRIRGGRATYEAVAYSDDTPGDRVRLQRLQPKTWCGHNYIRVITRYVDPDTELEPVGEESSRNFACWEG